MKHASSNCQYKREADEASIPAKRGLPYWRMPAGFRVGGPAGHGSFCCRRGSDSISMRTRRHPVSLQPFDLCVWCKQFQKKKNTFQNYAG